MSEKNNRLSFEDWVKFVKEWPELFVLEGDTININPEITISLNPDFIKFLIQNEPHIRNVVCGSPDEPVVTVFKTPMREYLCRVIDDDTLETLVIYFYEMLKMEFERRKQEEELVCLSLF